MKIKAKQYAQSLFELVKDSDEKEAKKVIQKMAEVLVKNNQGSQVEKIISYFNSLWDKEKGVLEAEIISANKLDKSVVSLLNDYIVKLLGNKDVVLKERIDASIKGGFIIRVDDKIFDSSLDTRVKELKKVLNN